MTWWRELTWDDGNSLEARPISTSHGHFLSSLPFPFCVLSLGQDLRWHRKRKGKEERNGNERSEWEVCVLSPLSLTHFSIHFSICSFSHLSSPQNQLEMVRRWDKREQIGREMMGFLSLHASLRSHLGKPHPLSLPSFVSSLFPLLPYLFPLSVHPFPSPGNITWWTGGKEMEGPFSTFICLCYLHWIVWFVGVRWKERRQGIISILSFISFKHNQITHKPTKIN